MTPEERNEIRKNAKDNHDGDLGPAVLEYLGADGEEIPDGHECPVGWENGYHGVKEEVEQYADADAAGTSNGSGTTTAKRKPAKKKVARRS
jgi:hypothetical protein